MPAYARRFGQLRLAARFGGLGLAEKSGVLTPRGSPIIPPNGLRIARPERSSRAVAALRCLLLADRTSWPRGWFWLSGLRVGSARLGVFAVSGRLVSVSVSWVGASGGVLGSVSFGFGSRSACARWLWRLRAARRWWWVGGRSVSSAADPCRRFGVPVPSLRWLWFRFGAAGGVVLLSVRVWGRIRRFAVPRGSRGAGRWPWRCRCRLPLVRWLCSRSSGLRSVPLPSFLWRSVPSRSGLRAELPLSVPVGSFVGC